ncbi:MAG TPA: proton-conducting transporter membrane subunit [Thermoanaerobaculaceae bacterium]|nr:proton-conducting transporter membrane subunit [Thermoanaerobaculaceae bacterium]
MTAFLAALGLIIAGGVASLLAGRWRSRAAVGGIVAGSLCGLVAAVRVLIGGPTPAMRLPWRVPYGSFSLAIDPVSALFLLALFVLAPLAAVYGGRYLEEEHGGEPLGGVWFFTSLLIAGIALVFTARNAVLFLVAWEVMSVAAYFLVTFEHRRDEVREAGWTYLVATHLGTAFLIAMFLLMGRAGGSLEFDEMQLGHASPAVAGLLFVLAVVGFGTKAGLVPFHVWLPEAHPAAPSHISALMSGVMIKTGIYGLLRVLLLLPSPPAWWGWLLVAMGVVSGVGGVLFALAQHDLKRLLAYHSVENIGIITLGLGVGLLGVHAGLPLVALAGFAGALLHVLNHALFKGLLFLGAGAVAHATGTRDLDQLGGLGKRMPWTGGTFLIGAAAISGLPPLNGFVSEFLIYTGAFAAALTGRGALLAAAVAAAAGLALIGGLALACFTKAFGAVFLGEPRSPRAGRAGEVAAALRLPMAALAAACAAIGLAAPWVLAGMARTLAQVAQAFGLPSPDAQIETLRGALAWVSLGALALLAAVALAVLARRLLLRGRTVTAAPTWGCGYSAPSPRMQYTASSFAQPLVDLFQPVLRTEATATLPSGAFPGHASFASATPDPAERRLYRPLFAGVAALFGRLRWVQQGRIQLYLLYLVATLLILLLWKVR